jgi:hypothetical protein
MSLLGDALDQTTVEYIDTTTSHDDQDLIDAGVLTADTVVYYGDESIDVTDLLGVDAISSSYVVATGGADVTYSAGLLDISLLTSTTFVIDGDSSITVDAADLSVGSLFTDSITVAFTGSGDGTFIYDPPSVALATTTTIIVEEMAAGDKIVIPMSSDDLEESSSLFSSAYEDGYLTLEIGNGVTTQKTYIKIAMTQEEYDLYAADPDQYLYGDTFVFPGDDSDEAVYDVEDTSDDAPCFAAGTLIKTQRGEVPVEKLTAGDLVLTLDHGYAPISWVGSRQLHAIDLARNPNLRPIRIQSGALGENQPEQDLVVSPQHRVLVRSAVAERMFGSREVLVAAKHLVGILGVQVENEIKEVSYWHFMFKTHELVFSGGAVTESMYAGPQALKSISDEARDELFTLFPELRPEHGALPQPARQLIPGRSGRQLAFRLAKNSKSAVEAV